MAIVTNTADDSLPDARPQLLRNTRRLELYVISAPVMIIVAAQAIWPLAMTALAAHRHPTWGAIAAALVVIALLTVELVIFRRGLPVLRSVGYGIGRRPMLGWGAVLIVLLALLTVLAWSELDDPQTAGVLMVCYAAAWASLSISSRLRTAAIGTVVVIAIGTMISVIGWTSDDRLGFGMAVATGVISSVSYGAMVAFAVLGIWSSGWMLRVIREIDRARGVAAELAIAEERLRMSRDLHDVFGRTLAAVAVKSELAEELARRGQADRSATEMAAVRQLAQDTGREIRTLVRGYRKADLDRELIGARALLDSAGISCQITGRPPALPPRVASTLAWVIREAVTNVIRHSQATQCTISFQGSDPATMTIDNNGVTDRPRTDERVGVTGSGHGLINIADRMAEIDGTVDFRQGGGRFGVVASWPVDHDQFAGQDHAAAPDRQGIRR